MEFSASNMNNSAGTFDVRLSVTEESFEDATFFISMGLTRIITEFIVQFTDNKSQAKALHRVINKYTKHLVDDFISSGLYTQVKREREEIPVYKLLEKYFDTWLEEQGMSRQGLIEFFSGSKTLSLEPELKEKMGIETPAGEKEIVIYLSNGEKSLSIQRFEKKMIFEKLELEAQMDKAYSIALVAGDLLMGEENPIRANYTPQDKGLIESIKKLI